MLVDDPATFMKDFSVVAMGGTCTLNVLPFDGIFDNGSVTVLNMLGGNNPILECPEISLGGSDPRGKTLIVNSVSYVVCENKPDGNGWTVLELDKV